MATFLYRLGRFSFRRRRLVLALWIAVLAALGIGMFSVSAHTSSSFAVPGTQSQKAQDLLKKQFPQASAGGATARVVFEAPEGQKLTSGAHRSEVESLVGELKRASQVANVVDPYTGGTVSRDGTIAFAQVTYKVTDSDVTDRAREDVKKVAEEGREAGLVVSMGGSAMREGIHQGVGEVIGILVAAVVLAITFGSLIAAGLPLLTAVAGVITAISSITIASAFIDLSTQTSTLALMLGLAVAIDYALFIVSRYRDELGQGRDPEEAAGRALGTAGSAVVFAGLTVVIALAGLSVIGIKLLTDLGLGGAFAIVVAVLLALTLLPALLGFTGTKIASGRFKTRRMRALERGEGESTGVRWSRLVLRKPLKALGVCVTGLLVLGIPFLSLQLALPDDSTASPGSTQRIAYETIAKGFGPGYNGPLAVVVDARGSDDAPAAAKEAAGMLEKLPDIVSVSPAAFNPSGDVALIRAVPGSSPTSQDTVDLVSAIRDQGPHLQEDTGAQLMVTGTTAINIDTSSKLNAALFPYLSIVISLAMVLLLLVFRSILVPLTATLGFLLSVLATLGAVVAVFQWGWLADMLGIEQASPIVSVLPIIMVGVVFGLAMDYQVFLVTRMREEYIHGAEPREAVIAGFRHSGRVVTAAAVIMISVFAGFMLAPDALMKSVGFGLAVSVLFDAFVVRMTIVPAVMALLGRRAWSLPAWLDRMLPNMDVEGERLRHLLDDPMTSTVPAGAELVGVGVGSSSATVDAILDGYTRAHHTDAATSGEANVHSQADAPAPSRQRRPKLPRLPKLGRSRARDADTDTVDPSEPKAAGAKEAVQDPQ
ncbi:MMPL family transporter [Streptomyces humidus]|uniref:MMPL family transporter n=1 Tax=Streptomyces humidus TaxID=52259 RepID=UPI00332B39B0